jgi:serpin B
MIHKMKKYKIHSIGLLMLAALFSITSCDSSDDTETTGPVVCPTDQTTTSILEASINKAFPLFAAVDAATKANENFTISPLSLSEMLAMASNGANGETRKQINSIIGVNDNISKESLNEAFNGLNEYLAKVDSKTTFTTANSVWIDEGFKVKPEFLSDKKFIGETFNQKLSTTKTRDDINNWCDVKTHSCIKKVLSEPLPETCRMVLANALYFKGMWKNKFSKDDTKEKEFTNSDGSKSKVQMMSQVSEFLAYEGIDMDFAEFPYGNDNYCMDVFLPHEDKKLDECMKNFDQKTFEEYLNKAGKGEVLVEMPRMKLEYMNSLVKPLKAMGMTDAFSEKADFSGLSDEKVSISDVIQATFVNVDEEGTEAAAVTVATLDNSVMPMRTSSFIMNRPFVYIIREKTSGTILFMGKVRKL